MEDSKIIELFFERSEQAIVELSDKYGTVCRKTANNILRNSLDAEECVNDAFLGAWNAIPPNRPENLPSYVLRIVRNLSIKRYRYNTADKRNNNYDLALDELAEYIPDTNAAYDDNDLSQLINKFLSTLKKDDRKMFVMRYFMAESLGDIAKLFGRTQHYVSVRLSRVREKLKNYLMKEGIFL